MTPKRNRARSAWRRILGPLVLGLAVSACGGRGDCIECKGPAPPPPAYQPICRTGLERMVPRPPEVLLLSGGGSRGAWGAGVLNGWSERDDRPEFDVVTGISTGALQATFAFLGRGYDAQLEEAYTSVSNRQIYRKRLFFWDLGGAFVGSSMRTTGPLRKLIEQYVSDDVIREVATQQGRRLLCVGTVNLDSGAFVAWDLTRIAAGAARDPARYDLYRAVVLASATMPVVFEPVEIDGALHVDGGVREQLFARLILEDLVDRSRRAAPAARGISVWALVNGKLVAKRTCVAENGIRIGIRSIDLLMTEAKIGNLHKSEALLRELGGDVQLRVSHIPDGEPLELDSMDFDQAKMQELFDQGVKAGRAGDWSEGVPPIGSSPLPCDQ